MTEISQDALDKECQHAELYESDYKHMYDSKGKGPVLILCDHESAGHKDSFNILNLCVACKMHSPNYEYGPYISSNNLWVMDSCEHKIPLTPDKERHIKRLYDQDMIYTKAIRMQEKIDSRQTDDIVLKDDKDIEGMIALTIVNYLKSNDYYTKNFKERLQAREDIKRKIETIAQNIEKTLEARM